MDCALGECDYKSFAVHLNLFMPAATGTWGVPCLILLEFLMAAL